MVPPGRSTRDTARSAIAEMIESPAETRSLLPTVVGMLDHEDRQVRLSAACGVCLAGTNEPDLVEYLVRRLIDRLEADQARPEVVFAFEYLATQFPKRVDEKLQEIREESDREPLAYTRNGGFRRSQIYDPMPDNRDVGRTRMAGSGRDAGPQQVYSDEADPEERRRHREDDEDDEDIEEGEVPDGETVGDDRKGSPEERETDRDADAGTDPNDETEQSDDVAGTVLDPSSDTVPTGVIEAMVQGPVFDDVAIRAVGETTQYAECYRLLGIVRGIERSVDLRVLFRPEGGTGRFAERLQRALRNWAAIEGTHVLSVFDYGQDPEPWTAVELAESSLDDRAVLSPDEAVWSGSKLADALTQLHQNGVFHGALEPRAVAYTGATDDDTAYREPALDHVGLLEAYRFSDRPERYLDPRYAAPEYFDRRYGSIDNATDIYQLGTVCYHMLTGQPPFPVEPSEARGHVLGETPTPPSAVLESVPTAVDRVIRKAMAKQKLTRYESAAQLQQDLLQVRRNL